MKSCRLARSQHILVPALCLSREPISTSTQRRVTPSHCLLSGWLWACKYIFQLSFIGTCKRSAQHYGDGLRLTRNRSRDYFVFPGDLIGSFVQRCNLHGELQMAQSLKPPEGRKGCCPNNKRIFTGFACQDFVQYFVVCVCLVLQGTLEFYVSFIGL